MLKKTFKAVLLIFGILLLVLALLYIGDLVYTLINPHIVFAGNSMINEIMIVFVTSFIGFIIINLMITNDKKRYYFQKTALYCLFAVYIIVILTSLFGRAVYTRIGKASDLMGVKSRLSTANFIPFRTIALYIYAYYNETVNFSVIFENLIGNFLLFMPMGVFLPLIYKGSRIKHCLLVILVLIAIEVVQLITDRGILDVDDVILNFGGFFLVYCFVRSKVFGKIMKKLHVVL